MPDDSSCKMRKLDSPTDIEKNRYFDEIPEDIQVELIEILLLLSQRVGDDPIVTIIFDETVLAEKLAADPTHTKQAVIDFILANGSRNEARSDAILF
jgi:hypothetical protein